MKAGFRKRIFIITGMLLLFWLLLIYGFSASNASLSGSQSEWIADLIRKLHLEWLVPETIEGGSFEANVRKLAHMTEYAVLEVLFFFFIYQIPRRFLRRITRAVCSIFLSFGASFFSACLDEYHQTFVSGRAGLFSDVLIDTRGIIAGLMISMVFTTFLYVYRRMDRGSWKFLQEK